jgi:hypothetical protein
MPVGSVAQGFLNSIAKYLSSERERRRKAEDADLDYQIKLISALADRPDANPALLGKALHDLTKLSAAKVGRRQKAGSEGFLGASELPISQFLEGIKSGFTPIVGRTTETIQRPGFENRAVGPIDPSQLPRDAAAPTPRVSTDFVLTAPEGLAFEPKDWDDIYAPGGAEGTIVDLGVAGIPPPPARPHRAPLTAMQAAAAAMQETRPVERQPLLIDPDELAEREGRGAGFKTKAQRLATHAADVAYYRDMLGMDEDEIVELIKRKEFGRQNDFRMDTTPEVFQGPNGEFLTRYMIMDQQTGVPREVTIPAPPGFTPYQRPGTERQGSIDQQSLDLMIAEEEAKLGRKLTIPERSALLRKFRLEDANLRRPSINIARDPFGMTTQQHMNVVGALQTRYERSREDLTTMETQVGQMDAAYASLVAQIGQGRPVGPQHIAIILQFNRTVDPDSVVREGEFDRSTKGQSWFNRLRGLATRMKFGGVGLTHREIEEYYQLSKDILSRAAERYRSALLPAFAAQAQKAGIALNEFMRQGDIRWVQQRSTSPTFDPSLKAMEDILMGSPVPVPPVR